MLGKFQIQLKMTSPSSDRPIRAFLRLSVHIKVAYGIVTILVQLNSDHPDLGGMPVRRFFFFTSPSLRSPPRRPSGLVYAISAVDKRSLPCDPGSVIQLA